MTSLPKVPLLHAGDRLSRVEFERRWTAMPDLKHAELLEGVVYMPSPVRLSLHGVPHGILATWLGRYVEATPDTHFSIDSTLRIDEDNAPQPDLALWRANGGARVEGDDYLAGAPELVVEVASSTVSYDLHQKLHVYRRAGVREYLVLRTEDAAVDWFVLRAGVYERLPADAVGVIRSEAFPGLWLAVPALLAHDHAALAVTLRAGLAARGA